jgi:hypothetical protein
LSFCAFRAPLHQAQWISDLSNGFDRLTLIGMAAAKLLASGPTRHLRHDTVGNSPPMP